MDNKTKTLNYVNAVKTKRQAEKEAKAALRLKEDEARLTSKTAKPVKPVKRKPTKVTLDNCLVDGSNDFWDSVGYCVWLIKKHNWSLKEALKNTVKKKDYKVKAHIEKGVRSRLPENYFIERNIERNNAAFSQGNNSSLIANYYQNKAHFKSI